MSANNTNGWEEKKDQTEENPITSHPNTEEEKASYLV
jgi:hypothetical protein